MDPTTTNMEDDATEEERENKKQFDSLGLDARLVKALHKCGIIEPTPVQEQTIPLALQKKDILMRAKTGSGKTLAFLLPLLENLLRFDANNPIDSSMMSQSLFTYNNPNRTVQNKIKAIIIAPSRELVSQIGSVLSDLTKFCHKTISFYVLSGFGKYGLNSEKPRLLECPNIIVSTPARLANHLRDGNLTLNSVEHIIIDEADLIMTHDFENDIKTIVLSMSGLLKTVSQSKNVSRMNGNNNNNNNNNNNSNNFDSSNGNYGRPQIVMCSATLNPHTSKLQEYFLMHHPIIVEIDESGFDNSKLTEYYFQVSTFGDKFLVMYGLFNLNIIKGKCIVFVHNIDLSYRLKLFLEKFMIPTAVLNPTLPYNSRQSVIDKFNRGMFKYLITTDAIDEHERQRIEKLRELNATNDNDNENENENDKNIEESEEEEEDDDDNDKEESKNEKENEKSENEEEDDDIDLEMNSNKSKSQDKKKSARMKNDDKTNMKKGKKRRIGVNESKGLIAHRGVDFREVSAVINFSAPFNYRKYIHRIGRTARAGNYGVALTLVTPREMESFGKIIEIRNKPKQDIGNEPSNINATNENSNGNENGQRKRKRFLNSIQELPLAMNDLNAFKYRCDSVRCSITSKLVKQARMNELRMEVLNSKRLLSHFKDRQREYELLRHDKMLQPADMVKPHLAHVPSYMLANTNLRTPKSKYHSATQQYKQLFGQLPTTLKEHYQKKRLRKAMKHNPNLRKQVAARRRYNLSQKRKMQDNASGKNLLHKKEQYAWLNKSTAVRGDNAGEDYVKDSKVFIKPVRHWKAALKTKVVKTGKRKASLKGMSKRQVRMLRKREKLKKLGNRRKK